MWGLIKKNWEVSRNFVCALAPLTISFFVFATRHFALSNDKQFFFLNIFLADRDRLGHIPNIPSQWIINKNRGQPPERPQKDKGEKKLSTKPTKDKINYVFIQYCPTKFKVEGFFFFLILLEFHDEYVLLKKKYFFSRFRSSPEVIY